MLHTFLRTAAALLVVSAARAAVTPANLNRSRTADSITITATGTAATLDGNPFPLGTATAVTSIGFHDLVVTDGGVTTSYKFIVRNSERKTTEDGIPTMKPFRLIMDAPGAFSDAQLSVMAPAVFPKNLPIPVAARLTKGPASGALAGDPLFLNGRISAENHPGQGILLRRGWGSTILPAATAAGARDYDAVIHGRSSTAPVQIEETTTWTTKSGDIAASENWGSNARIHLNGTLRIAAGATLTIGAGTVVRCAPGVEIWVRPGGTMTVNGTTGTPVVFVPDSTSALWGGIWLHPQSGANVARFTATGTLFCCWGANQDWFATAPAGEPAKTFPHHRNQQPCIATAPGAVTTLTDCALIGPTGLSQSRGAALATNGGSLNFTRVLAQRCITGGEQESCPFFEMTACAFIEMNEPGTNVDSDTFDDLDNDGLYLVPGTGRTYRLNKCLVGWTKDDGIDTGGGGGGSTLCYDCWFENCIHEGISNSGVDRIPQSYRGVHFNNGQGMECGYGAPHSLVKDCLIIGNMVGARFGDNYGNNTGLSGTGANSTDQFMGDITADGSLMLYNYFHDTWSIDFSRWSYSNQPGLTETPSRPTKFVLVNSKVTKAEDLAVQNGAEDTGNSLWDPVADAQRLAAFMPAPGSPVGIDFPIIQRQGTYSAFPGTFNVRLSTFSSSTVSAQWEVLGKASPEAPSGTVIASGTVSWLPGETLKSFTTALPVPNPHGIIEVRLGSPVNGAITGDPLWYFPPAGAPPPDQVLVPKNSAGWSYHAALTPGGWTTATEWPPLDTASRKWTNPLFNGTTNWYANVTTPLGWGTIGTGTTLTFGTTITERPVTVYARKAFTISDPLVSVLKLECMADDGAAVYINGTRVSPVSWGVDSGTNLGGAIYYNQLSARFQGNGSNEYAYDLLNLTGASLPALNAAPEVNVLAVEVHQNSVDSSDCSLDAALTASYPAPGSSKWGLGRSVDASFLFWTNPAWTLETSTNLTGDWTARPDLTSPVRVVGETRRMFYRITGTGL